MLVGADTQWLSLLRALIKNRKKLLRQLKIENIHGDHNFEYFVKKIKLSIDHATLLE